MRMHDTVGVSTGWVLMDAFTNEHILCIIWFPQTAEAVRRERLACYESDWSCRDTNCSSVRAYCAACPRLLDCLQTLFQSPQNIVAWSLVFLSLWSLNFSWAWCFDNVSWQGISTLKKRTKRRVKGDFTIVIHFRLLTLTSISEEHLWPVVASLRKVDDRW